VSWGDYGEDRLNLVLEATRVGLWDWNVQTGETFFTERWAEIVGYTLEELAPVNIETWTQLVHPDDLAQSEELLRRHFSGEISYYECECRMRHKNGHWVWVLDRGMVVACTEDGAPLRMTGTHADITERKQGEERERQARENFETLFNTVRDFLFVLDEQGRILHVNSTVLNRLGWSADELAGRSVMELHPPEYREDAGRIVQDMLAGLVDLCPVPLVTKNGELIPVETRVTTGVWDSCPVLFGVSKDITEYKRSEAALQKQTALLSCLLDSIPDIIFFKDRDGIYLGCNPQFCEFTGILRDKIIGQTDYELFDRESADFFREQDGIVMERYEPHHNEEWVTYPDGRKVLLDTLKAPLFSETGEVLGLLGVSRNITDRKKAEKELALRESYLSAIIENLPGLVWMKDEDSRFLAVNRAFAHSCGFEKTDLEEKTDLDIWPEDLAALYRNDDLKVMQASAPIITEEPIADQGHRRWFETFKTPVVDERGDVIGTVGYSQNITERKESREKIERLNELQAELVRLATGFVNVPVPRYDEAVNEALRTIGGLIGADRAYLFHYDFTSGVMNNTHEWCAGGIGSEMENLQGVPVDLFPDWQSAHCRGKAYFVPDVQSLATESALRKVLEPQGIQSLITLPLMDQSSCLGFVGFDAVRECRVWNQEEVQLLHVLAEMLANLEVKRRTEAEMERLNLEQRTLIVRLEEMQQQLIRARDDAEAGARAKSMFLANMSHEIRTPLNAILGHTQILQRKCAGCPSGRDSLGPVATAGEHLLGLINDVLATVQTDSQDVILSSSVFDFYQMLDSVQTICGQNLQEEVSLNIVKEESVPRTVQADKGKIRQVLINLIGNAMKFTEKGSVEVAVSASSCSSDGFMFCADVSDSGCGIEAEAMETVFDPFEQSASGRLLQKGAGLGLSISRRYARAMGGDVSVLKSRVGEGSTFRFLFRAIPGKVCAMDGQPSIERVHPSQGSIPRLLAADDDVSNLNMLTLMLRTAGFDVEAASSGGEVLERLQDDSRFDLVLLDKRMPRIDGKETLRRLRELPGCEKLPVIIITASGLKDERQALLDLGADGYISKPVDRDALLDEVGRLTGVRYCYDSKETAPASVSVPLQQLGGLPRASCVELLQAVRHGDLSGMRRVIEEIEPRFPEIAVGLSRLVRRYDYDRMTDLLTTSIKETSDE
jgi:PAS domain S-box-containing protein